jgi:hypothetical protein
MVEAQGVSPEQLQKTFNDYCGAGQTTMDGKGFAKLAKDTKLLDKKLTTTDVDLAFSKIKERTARRITFDQFLAGLALFAEKKQVGVDAVYAKVGASQGPVLRGTQAEAVRFHDDKDQYTGVHAHGGPSTVDNPNQTLEGLLDRSDADVRGVKTGGCNPRRRRNPHFRGRGKEACSCQERQEKGWRGTCQRSSCSISVSTCQQFTGGLRQVREWTRDGWQDLCKGVQGL